MARYDTVFDGLGLRDWCDADKVAAPLSMEQLLARTQGDAEAATGGGGLPFPSLDTLHESCARLWQTRDLTEALETGFLSVRSELKFVLDPMTQPLSWMLDQTLFVFEAAPWWVMMPALILLAWWVSRSRAVTGFVTGVLLLFALVDHYEAAMQTLAIVFVCTGLSVLIGVPIGIGMSKSDTAQRSIVPILDLLQTLPTFVYLIPLVFLFAITESKLYGIAIILYAIVPVIRLTDLGVRLVDRDVIEAANAFGLTTWQKLIRVELPLALPNIMAGVNQTIMMSLAMVVIASLVSAPGLGVLVLRGIRALDLGVGMVAGLGIVLLAVVLDRVSKAALGRVDARRPGK